MGQVFVELAGQLGLEAQHSGLVVPIAIGVASMLVLVVGGFVIGKFVRARRKRRDSKYLHVERQNLPGGKPSTAAVKTKKRGASVSWKKEWGKLPLQLMQDHPEIDWTPFLMPSSTGDEIRAARSGS